MLQKTLSTRHSALLVAVAIAGSSVLSLVLANWLAGRPFPGDFLIYRYGARAANAGADLYAHNVIAPQLPGGQPFTYPPFAAIALQPVTWFGWRTAWLLWCAASTVALGAVLASFVPASVRARPLVVAGVLAAASTTWVYEHNIVEGQINLLLLALCLADARRRVDGPLATVLPRGALVGLATAIKLTPGLFVVYFVLTRQWRIARTAVVAAAMSTALAAAVYPATTATFFRSALWSLPGRVDTFHDIGHVTNSSVNGAVHAMGGWAAPLAQPAVVAVLACGLLAARAAHRDGRETDAWLVVGLLAPLVSPVSWIHHLVYVLPALTRIGFAGGRRRGVRIAAVAAAAIVLHWKPADGAALLHRGGWLFVPGLALREWIILVSAGCIVWLAKAGARVREIPDAGRRSASVRWRNEPSRLS